MEQQWGTKVATLNTLRTGSLIDAAFLAPVPPTSRPAARFAARHERAMATRLQQLHSALGAPEMAPHAAAPHLVAVPDTTPSMTIDTDPRRSRKGVWPTLLACLLSAGLGAATTWLFMSDAGSAPGTRASAAIAPIPATVIAEPAPVAATLPSPVIELAPASVSDEVRIGEVVESWRLAWRDHDIANYLGTYGSAFQPADGGSRDAWVAARTKKLANPAAITVDVRDLRIEQVTQDRYKVSFLQDYASGSYRETGRGKILELARENGTWKIVRELQTP